MAVLWIILGIIFIAGYVGISVMKRKWKTKQNTMRSQAKENGKYTAEEIEEALANEPFMVPGFASTGVIVMAVFFLGLGAFNKVFFYAEPGYIYHVRTIFGEERVISGTGYYYHYAGRINDWKREMSVQASGSLKVDSMSSENESAQMSAGMAPLHVTMLDQVGAKVSATARFRLPSDREAFLTIAHNYRTPENLLRTSLIPQFKEVLKANGSLMGAEKYFSGGRSEFQNDFEAQMVDGIFIVERIERTVVVKPVKGSANAAKGTNQDEFGEKTKTIFEVVKLLTDDTKLPRVKLSKSKKLGIEVVEARVTDLVPNDKFRKRMELKQQASADRAIAREQRIQEVEQKLLADAKGARQVAEKLATAKVNQIEKTTDAETTKQLAITAANQLKEQAAIQEETAAINYRRDKIKAKSVKVLADAQAYKKREILKADNALAQKLKTEENIQKVWADAYAKRAVPQYVFGGGGEGGTPVGGDTETNRFMQLMTIDAAKRLSYDRSLNPSGKK